MYVRLVGALPGTHLASLKRAVFAGLASCFIWVLISRWYVLDLERTFGPPAMPRGVNTLWMLRWSFSFLAWAIVAVSLLASGRRKLFWLPVVLWEAQFLVLPLWMNEFRWNLWRLLAMGAAFSLLTITPALSLLRRPRSEGSDRLERPQIMALIACACLCVGIAVAFDLSQMRDLLGYVAAWTYLPSILAAGALFLFGAGVNTKGFGWPKVQAVVPLLLFAQLSLTRALLAMVICFLAAMWPRMAEGWFSGRRQARAVL